MFEPVKEGGVVKSIKCRRHVESGKNSNFARVYVFEDVIRKFEQGQFQLSGTCGKQTEKD